MKLIVIDVRITTEATPTLQQKQAADGMCVDVRTMSCRMLVLMNPRQPLHVNQKVFLGRKTLRLKFSRETSVTADETL